MKLALCQMAMSDNENENLTRQLAALRQAALHGAELIVYPREPSGCFDATLLIGSDGTLLGRQKMVHIA